MGESLAQNWAVNVPAGVRAALDRLPPLATSSNAGVEAALRCAPGPGRPDWDAERSTNGVVAPTARNAGVATNAGGVGCQSPGSPPATYGGSMLPEPSS